MQYLQEQLKLKTGQYYDNQLIRQVFYNELIKSSLSLNKNQVQMLIQEKMQRQGALAENSNVKQICQQNQDIARLIRSDPLANQILASQNIQGILNNNPLAQSVFIR